MSVLKTFFYAELRKIGFLLNVLSVQLGIFIYAKQDLELNWMHSFLDSFLFNLMYSGNP